MENAGSKRANRARAEVPEVGRSRVRKWNSRHSDDWLKTCQLRLESVNGLDSGEMSEREREPYLSPDDGYCALLSLRVVYCLMHTKRGRLLFLELLPTHGSFGAGELRRRETVREARRCSGTWRNHPSFGVGETWNDVTIQSPRSSQPIEFSPSSYAIWRSV